MIKIKTLSKSFGFRPEDSQHHFQVLLPENARNDDVLITEHFSWRDGVLDKGAPWAALSFNRWLMIAESVEEIFNLRLIKAGMRQGKWQPGRNCLERLLGKELIVLVWAIEEAPLDQIPNACGNWRGLTPEERWWLCTQAGANPVVRDPFRGRGLGWRKALQIALCYA